jgi:hypothetical protein
MCTCRWPWRRGDMSLFSFLFIEVDWMVGGEVIILLLRLECAWTCAWMFARKFIWRWLGSAHRSVWCCCRELDLEECTFNLAFSFFLSLPLESQWFWGRRWYKYWTREFGREDMIQIPLTRFQLEAIDGNNNDIEHYRFQMRLDTQLNQNGWSRGEINQKWACIRYQVKCPAGIETIRLPATPYSPTSLSKLGIQLRLSRASTICVNGGLWPR